MKKVVPEVPSKRIFSVIRTQRNFCHNYDRRFGQTNQDQENCGRSSLRIFLTKSAHSENSFVIAIFFDMFVNHCDSQSKRFPDEQFGWFFWRIQFRFLPKLYRVGQSATSPSKIGKIFSKSPKFLHSTRPCLTESWIFYSRFVSSRRVSKNVDFSELFFVAHFSVSLSKFTFRIPQNKKQNFRTLPKSPTKKKHQKFVIRNYSRDFKFPFFCG